MNNCLTKDGLSTPNAAMTWGLTSAQVLQLNRGSDGAVFGIGRTGGSNNPSIKFNISDAGGLSIVGAGIAAQSTISFSNTTTSVVNNTAPSTYEANFQLSVTSYAAAAFALNGSSSTDVYGIPAGAFGIGVVQGITMALGTAGTSRLTINSAGAVVVNTPSSAATTFTLNGYANSTTLAIASGNSGSVASADIYLTRPGSLANSIYQGPNLVLNDTTGATQSLLQQAGGQTELWQYNGGTWRQVLAVTNYSGGYNFSLPNMFTSGSATAGGISVPATVAGYLAVTINGTTRKIPYYAN